MQDALLNQSLRVTIVGTISATTLACLILGYQGLFELITLDLPSAGVKFGWGLLSGVSALLLIRYRTDLIDT